MEQEERLGCGGRLFTVVYCGFLLSAIYVYLRNVLRDPTGSFRDNWNGHWSGWSDGFSAAAEWLPLLGQFTLLALASAVIVGLVAMLMSLGRARRANAFISYHHSRLSEVHRLAVALRESGLTPTFVPFQSRGEHDALLLEIDDHIRRAHFILCLPGAEPSFVDHEVMTAMGQRKRVVLLIDSAIGTAPNTALKSYPAMDLAAVLARPGDLTRFLTFLWGGPGATFRLLTCAAIPPGYVMLTLFLACVAVLALLVITSAIHGLSVFFGTAWELARASAFSEARNLSLFGLSALSLIVAVLALSPLSALLYRRFTQSDLDSRTAKGQYSYAMFGKHLSACGLDEIRKSFLKKAPPAWHQLQGKNPSMVPTQGDSAAESRPERHSRPDA